MVDSSPMKDKSEGYKIKVNENSFLLFETKKHYRFIKELEKIIFCLVSDVLNENEYEYCCEIYGTLGERFDGVVKYVKERPLMNVKNIVFENDEDLVIPFEEMFPTLFFYFLNLEVCKEKRYLFNRRIRSKNLVSVYKDLKTEICKVIQLKIH